MKKIAAENNYKVFKKAQQGSAPTQQELDALKKQYADIGKQMERYRSAASDGTLKSLMEKMRIAEGRLAQHDKAIRALQAALKGVIGREKDDEGFFRAER